MANMAGSSSGCGCFAIAETGVPGVLARLCGTGQCGRLGIPDRRGISAAIDRRVSHHRSRGTGISGQPTKGLRTICFGRVGSTVCTDRQVRIRVRHGDVRRNWPAGRCIFLELVAE